MDSRHKMDISNVFVNSIVTQQPLANVLVNFLQIENISFDFYSLLGSAGKFETILTCSI